ncbi:unnamed protein product, partial [marine sediment metagenome]
YFELERVSAGNPAIQGASIEELESVLLDWSQYTSTYKQDYGAYGFEYSYKLPVVGKEGLESIHIAFDASISSTSIVKEFPLSIQLWNFEQNRWESIPMAPLGEEDTYLSSDLDAEFWAWDPEATSYDDDKFRPKWGTLNFENINTINYGDCFPNSLDSSGNVIFDTSITNGGNFLKNDDSGRQVNNLFANDNFKVMFYDSDLNANKFQLSNLI